MPFKRDQKPNNREIFKVNKWKNVYEYIYNITCELKNTS